MRISSGRLSVGGRVKLPGPDGLVVRTGAYIHNVVDGVVTTWEVIGMGEGF